MLTCKLIVPHGEDHRARQIGPMDELRGRAAAEACFQDVVDPGELLSRVPRSA